MKEKDNMEEMKKSLVEARMENQRVLKKFQQSQEEKDALMDQYIKGISDGKISRNNDQFRHSSVTSFPNPDLATPNKLLSPSSTSNMRMLSPTSGNLPKM